MKAMSKIIRDFICEEERVFKFKIGKILASALSGFIAGVIFTGIFWFITSYFILVKSGQEVPKLMKDILGIFGIG